MTFQITKSAAHQRLQRFLLLIVKKLYLFFTCPFFSLSTRTCPAVLIIVEINKWYHFEFPSIFPPDAYF